MREVYLDGERVEFEGAAPRTLGAVWAVLESHLGASGRLLERAALDGAEWAASAEDGLESWERLELVSVTVEDRLSGLARGWLEGADAMLAAVNALAGEVLRCEWSAAQAATVARLGELQPQIEGFGLLASYAGDAGWESGGELAEGFERCGAALEAAISAVERRDCAGLSDALAVDLGPALAGYLERVARAVLGEERRIEPGPAGSLAERWLSGVKLGEYTAVALCGLGDGEQVERLLERLPRGCAVFCGEADRGQFARFVASERGRRLQSDGRLFFGAGAEPDDVFFEAMSRFPVLEVQDAATLFYGPAANGSPGFGAAFFLQFVRRLDFWRTLFGTNAVSSGDWQGTVLANLERLIGAPDLGAFRGAFRGAEMVLVSAGPSLDESLAALRELGERAVIVAVNSSFRALRNAGIDPHFVIAADPYEWTDRGFAGVDLGRAVLICPFIVCPEVVRRFEGRIATWSENNLLASYFRLALGLGRGSYVVEQGTVAACAFDVAEAFGCSGLTFVGQDLALTASGQSHASDTFYADMQANQANVSGCRWLPGNTLDKVPVESKLYVYLKTFEQLARERGGRLRLRNASRLGARIEGIPYCPLAEVLVEPAQAAGKGGVGQAWASVAQRCKPLALGEALRREVGKLRGYAKEVTGLALRAALRLEIAEPAPDAAEARELRRELTALLEGSADFYALLRDGQLKGELLRHSRELRALEQSLEGDALEVEGQKSYFWAVAEGGFALLSAVEKGISGLDPVN